MITEKIDEYINEVIKKELSDEDVEDLSGIMDNEGFGYGFMDYSNFSEIKNSKFHTLRKKFVKAGNDLRDFLRNAGVEV